LSAYATKKGRSLVRAELNRMASVVEHRRRGARRRGLRYSDGLAQSGDCRIDQQRHSESGTPEAVGHGAGIVLRAGQSGQRGVVPRADNQGPARLGLRASRPDDRQ